MTLRLVRPGLDRLPGYAAALEAGWSPDTTRDVSAEQLAALRDDPLAFLDDLTRQDGTIEDAAGDIHPRLPSFVFWLDDGEFCGVISLRYMRGSDELPSHVSGHVGYAVVPWKRRRGYATKALSMLLPTVREAGLTRIEIVCGDDNEASRRVILANGGVAIGSRQSDGTTKLVFRIKSSDAKARI
jgi:predicted acetyltransferase